MNLSLVAAALLALVVVTAVVWGSPAAWLAAGLVLGIAVCTLFSRRLERQQAKKLRSSHPRQVDKHYVLVIANQTLSGEALRREIVHRSSNLNTEVEIVCPALNNVPEGGTSGEARERAQESLERMLEQLLGANVLARGRVGTADPIETVNEAMRNFPADEIIISTHPYGHSSWLEHDVVEYVRNHFPIPVTHVIVDLEHEKRGRNG